MTLQNPIVSLDIGTSSTRVVIGEVKNGTIHIVGVGSAPSKGIRSGAIVDIEQTVMSIQEAVHKAEQMVNIEIKSVFVGVSGSHLQLTSSSGVVAVSNPDREITKDDVDRVLNAAKVVSVPPERVIIDILPKQFIVDGVPGINDPKDMLGVRLEVEANIVTGSKTIIHNISRCVERAGLKVERFVLVPMSSGAMVLKKDVRELGAILIDMGAGGVNLSVFEQGRLVATSDMPVGGNHVTSDIAHAFKLEWSIAEEIKLNRGVAMTRLADKNEIFNVRAIGNNKDIDISQFDLSEVIEPRIQEIFHLVKRELKNIGYSKDIAAGFFLTGGVANLQGIIEMAEITLDAQVQIVMPNYLGVKDSSYTTGVGIIKYAIENANIYDSKAVNNTRRVSSSVSSTEGLFTKIKNFFKDFL